MLTCTVEDVESAVVTHPQYRPNPYDPLDPKIGEHERVAILYFLQDEFPPGRAHWMGGEVGGDEQRLLEEHLRKQFRVLELADGYRVSEILHNFIIVSGAPPELLFLLQEMPLILDHVLSQKRHSGYEVEDAVTSLKERILKLLADFGLQMAFDDNDKLVERAVDTTPKALAALPGKEALLSKLEVLHGSGEQVSIIFFDLDNFKQVNDKEGHSAGDACLANVAAVGAAVLKGKGALYRYGGDEFAVLLPNFAVDEALVTAERIRWDVDAAQVGGAIKVTASFGVATSEKDVKPFDLLQRADEAHYGSKFTGKNKVTSWPMNADVIEKVRVGKDNAKGR